MLIHNCLSSWLKVEQGSGRFRVNRICGIGRGGAERGRKQRPEGNTERPTVAEGSSNLAMPVMVDRVGSVRSVLSAPRGGRFAPRGDSTGRRTGVSGVGEPTRIPTKIPTKSYPSL